MWSHSLRTDSAKRYNLLAILFLLRLVYSVCLILSHPLSLSLSISKISPETNLSEVWFVYLPQVEMSGTKGPITTFIVEPFVPHSDEFYLSIVSDRLGANISFSECGGIEIEENWEKVRAHDSCAVISFHRLDWGQIWTRLEVSLFYFQVCLFLWDLTGRLFLSQCWTNLDGVQVRSVFIPTEKTLTSELCAPLIATLPLEVISSSFLPRLFMCDTM